MKVAVSRRLRTITDWYEYLEAAMGRYPGLVALEQAMFQSMRYKVCVVCLAHCKLVLQASRALIKSTDYYLCKPCLRYYKEKRQ